MSDPELFSATTREYSELEAQIVRYIIRPDVEVLPAGQYPEGEDRRGVYMLFDKDGAVNYIGQSNGIGYRVIQHLWAVGRGERRPFVEYGFVEVPHLWLDWMELAHIHAMEPPENVARPIPRWNRHDEAVALIREIWGPKK